MTTLEVGGRPRAARISLTNHRTLTRSIAGTISHFSHHGDTVEIALRSGARVDIPFEDAFELRKVAGPNLHGAHLDYDGHSVVVAWGKR